MFDVKVEDRDKVFPRRIPQCLTFDFWNCSNLEEKIRAKQRDAENVLDFAANEVAKIFDRQQAETRLDLSSQLRSNRKQCLAEYRDLQQRRAEEQRRCVEDLEGILRKQGVRFESDEKSADMWNNIGQP